jgi:hypothetical protein
MDELSAAAAVLAVAHDPDTDEEMEQEGAAGARGGDLRQWPAPESSEAGKENEHHLPEQQQVGTDNGKVMTHPPTPSHIPRAPSLTRYWHPTDLP